VVDAVERRGQVRVQRPCVLGRWPRAHVVNRADRVVAAPAQPEPVGCGLEPGLPLGLQRVADPRLMATVHKHGNPERPQLRTFDAFGIYTRLTARGCQDERDRCTRSATAVLASEVSATSPSIPAVLRPALRCVTCRTLTSVLDRLFRARAPGPISGQLCSAPGGRAGHDGAGLLLPFGRRHSLPGHPVPPGDHAPLTIGLPHRQRGGADPSG
jgi:hypothetical protein